MDEKVIVVEGLVKRFGQLTAVDGVSLSVRKGEVFGILGPNGAGKTTLLECVEGLQRPDAGSLHVLGLDVEREASAVKDRIGVQLQASAYFDYLTVTEILELLGAFYSRRVPAAALLSRVSLEDKAGATIRKLSGGQKQRFAIAATLVNDPEVVFLDEPTTGLDPQARRNLWGFISDVREGGRTVVLTTHYMEEAEALCDRVAIMDRGKVVALDTPSNLIQSLPAPYEIRVSLGDGLNAASALETLEAVVGIEAGKDWTISLRSRESARTVPALLDWAGRAQAGLSHLEVRTADLEEVFLALTGRGLTEDDEDRD